MSVQPIMLSLKELLRDGSVGPISIGISRALVQAALGPPTDWSTTRTKHRQAQIWKYGGLEFHFDIDDDTLVLIHLDDFVAHHPAVDAWVLGVQPTVTELEASLIRADIPYRQIPRQASDPQTMIETAGKVRLVFEAEDDDERRLQSVSMSSWR